MHVSRKVLFTKIRLILFPLKRNKKLALFGELNRYICMSINVNFQSCRNGVTYLLGNMRL